MTAPGDANSAEQFVHAMAVPRRHREPRRAEALEGAAPTFVDTRWGRLATWRLGSGPAVLLVHGYEDDHSLWTYLIDALEGRDRPVVAFDLPGHGASGGQWGMSFEGTDAIIAVTDELGPIDAVVAHSAGCGMTTAAIGEGWTVGRAAFIAPPLGEGDRWLRKAAASGVPEDVALAAKRMYFEAIGPHRAAWDPRAAYRALDVELLVIHSRDDEHSPAADTQEIMGSHPRANLVLVDDLTHRRTARDAEVTKLVADFVAP